MIGYSALDRVQHRLALQFRPLAELSFDLDQGSAKPDAAATAQGRHVFVSGLARAGTTILMRRLHDTGQFRSLTYRDMPFVSGPEPVVQAARLQSLGRGHRARPWRPDQGQYRQPRKPGRGVLAHLRRRGLYP